MRTSVAAALLLPLLVSCSGGDTPAPTTPDVAASAPVPGLTLPPDDLAELAPQPDEVPAGMVPLLTGSGPRTAAEVAAYSGDAKTAAAAQAKLASHGFSRAYVAQYANQDTAQVLSVVVSEFATAEGATADLADDLKAASGKAVALPVVGEESAVTIQDIPGPPAKQLVLVRFRRGVDTWALAYQASVADPQLAVDVANRILSRTTS